MYRLTVIEQGDEDFHEAAEHGNEEALMIRDIIDRYLETYENMPDGEKTLCLLCNKPSGDLPGAVVLPLPMDLDAAVGASVNVFGICQACVAYPDYESKIVKMFNDAGSDVRLISHGSQKVQ